MFGSSRPGGKAGAARPPIAVILTRYRAYRLLWATTVLTQAAQWMMQIALGWLMLDVTNSAGWVGLIGVASGVPFLLVSIPSGVLIDRFDRRLTLLASQAGGAAVGVGLALVVVWGVVAPWHLLAAAFLNGAMLAANSAARQTLVPALVERAHLQSAIALMSAGQNATRIVGPSLAGVLIAAGGAGGAFLAQAGCLLLALASTALLPPAPAATSEVLALRRNLIDGLAYIARSAVLSGLMLLAIIPTVLVFPYVQFLPVYARDILAVGADGLGLLYTGSGVGAVIGSLAVASLASLRRRGLFMLVGLVVYGALVTSFAYSTWVPLSVGLLALTSGLGSACMAMNNTLLLMHVTEEVRGRVMGVYTLTWGLSSLGALPMGFLGDHVSVPLAIAAGALTSSLLTAALAVRSRTLRAL